MKTIKFLAVCCLAICFFGACGTDVKISITGSDGTVYNSYQAACENEDFTAAREFVEYYRGLCKKDYWEYYKYYDEAREYVFFQQANLLISNGDENSAKRLLLLFKEEDLEKEEKTKWIDKLIETCSIFNNDFVIKELASCANLEDEQLIAYMVKANENEYSDYIVSLLSTEYGECKKPNAGLNDYYCCNSNLDSHSSEYNYLMFNSRLNKYLNLAISNHNKYLAQQVLCLYTPTVVKIQGHEYDNNGRKPLKYKGVLVDGNHSYIEFNNSEKTEAQRQFREAVKSGAFN